MGSELCIRDRGNYKAYDDNNLKCTSRGKKAFGECCKTDSECETGKCIEAGRQGDTIYKTCYGLNTNIRAGSSVTGQACFKTADCIDGHICKGTNEDTLQYGICEKVGGPSDEGYKCYPDARVNADIFEAEIRKCDGDLKCCPKNRIRPYTSVTTGNYIDNDDITVLEGKCVIENKCKISADQDENGEVSEVAMLNYHQEMHGQE